MQAHLRKCLEMTKPSHYNSNKQWRWRMTQDFLDKGVIWLVKAETSQWRGGGRISNNHFVIANNNLFALFSSFHY
jgi:hypothetical protein